MIKSKKAISKEVITSRVNNEIMYFQSPDKMKYYSGLLAKKIAQPYLQKKAKPQGQELKGLVVSPGQGNVVGTVRILHSPKEHHKMKPGDILVAAMTSPDYIVALKKAQAIITDEGGMTCHAAIVSRELGIPGIVGTKAATQIFKTGDKIEVNVEKGLVKKILDYVAAKKFS